MDNLCVIIKILIIFVLIIIFINIYKNSQEARETEGFTQQQDYIKLNETYIEPDGTNLKLLYANYYGEESSPPQDKWQHKTLEQCVDICNQLDGCRGFTRRANISDTVADECQPRTKIGICHSNRKGTPNQMQNAIKYNSYIKNSTSGNSKSALLTQCIGDPNLTLQRAIYIKSHMFPNKYIGTLGDGLVLLIDKNASDFDNKCKFRIEIGQDGTGTVSFLHLNSNKYLYRMPIVSSNTTSNNKSNNYEFIGLKDISTGGTDDKQRASFNILDAMKNRMKFQCLRVNGENIDKFIVINSDNQNYLLCSEIQDLPTEEYYTFNIVDTIINSKIITNKDSLSTSNQNIPSTTMSSTATSTTIPSTATSTTMPNTATSTTMAKVMNNASKEAFFTVDAIGNQIFTQTENPNVMNASNLDISSNLPLYSNIYNTPSNIKIGDYLSDNYGDTKYNNYTSIKKKANDLIVQKQLSKNLENNQNSYKALNQLNIEIEKEIAGLNMDLNAKNDSVVQKVGRMQIADMAKDYFTLKNSYPLAIE